MVEGGGKVGGGGSFGGGGFGIKPKRRPHLTSNHHTHTHTRAPKNSNNTSPPSWRSAACSCTRGTPRPRPPAPRAARRTSPRCTRGSAPSRPTRSSRCVCVFVFVSFVIFCLEREEGDIEKEGFACRVFLCVLGSPPNPCSTPKTQLRLCNAGRHRPRHAKHPAPRGRRTRP